MRILLFGASGMVGMGTLLECLDDPDVASVTVVGRHHCGVQHRKLHERLLPDLADVASLTDDLVGIDACFYCVGITSVGLTEAQYTAVTHDLTVDAANALVAASPQAVFVLVSGAGSDSSEKGSVMWARVKGRAENAILRAGFRAAYVFRPGLIQPERGVTSRTRWYRVFYALFAPFAPLWLWLTPQLVTTTTRIGRAMLTVARHGYPAAILGSRDINRAAATYHASKGSVA